MTLIDKIIRMLENRADFEIFAITDDSEIWCVQLRRVWNKRVLNESGFNPVDRESWVYFGQTVCIAEPKLTKKGEMIREQREFSTKHGRVGVHVVWAQTLDDVIDAVGPEPANVVDYLGRKEK